MIDSRSGAGSCLIGMFVVSVLEADSESESYIGKWGGLVAGCPEAFSVMGVVPSNVTPRSAPFHSPSASAGKPMTSTTQELIMSWRCTGKRSLSP